MNLHALPAVSIERGGGMLKLLVYYLVGAGPRVVILVG
ncbi:hypothetical protein FB004_11636 [Sinorhizobium medicae]|nr:hypothetical protein FB004_11636 [Sinorhizobium medicae]TWA31973.1 hypothetical protein FB009_1287 [Sinorhizobium medicae]